jgi:hypothetical protein
MAEDKVAELEGTSSDAPANASPDTTKTSDVVTMPKAEFDAFVKAQTEPWMKKHSDAEAALGQYKKLSKLPPEAFDAERNFEDMKTIVITLGVDAEDIKDAETVRDLKLLLRGYQKSEVKAAKGAIPDSEGYAAYETWKKAQEATATKRVGAAGEIVVPLKGGVPQGKSNAELADGIYDPEAMKARLRQMGVRV